MKNIIFCWEKTSHISFHEKKKKKKIWWEIKAAKNGLAGNFDLKKFISKCKDLNI